jgi:hypothetical protein
VQHLRKSSIRYQRIRVSDSIYGDAFQTMGDAVDFDMEEIVG